MDRHQHQHRHQQWNVLEEIAAPDTSSQPDAGPAGQPALSLRMRIDRLYAQSSQAAYARVTCLEGGLLRWHTALASTGGFRCVLRSSRAPLALAQGQEVRVCTGSYTALSPDCLVVCL